MSEKGMLNVEVKVNRIGSNNHGMAVKSGFKTSCMYFVL